ncbi:MAG: hypothetical protein ACU83O_02050 [Gammaproteobacteria bacterium]
MFMTAWLVSGSAAAGGALLCLVGLALPAFEQKRRRDNPMSPPELKAMAAAMGLAVLGSILLFVFPAYSSEGGTLAAEILPDATSRQTIETKTFLEVNGSGVIPFFTLPIVFALLPYFARRSCLRPALQGLCAFILGAQAAMGMSGYGLFFGPSGLAVLTAGLISMRRGR